MSDKEMAIETIRGLPDNVTLDDISHRLEFVAAVRRGLDQIKEGQTVPHEEVKRQLATWLSK